MNLHERLKELLQLKTAAAKRYKELEEITGIPINTWKSYFSKGIRPSADLIEAAAKAWPEHAFWLVTGAEDRKYGHNECPPVRAATTQTALVFKAKLKDDKTLAEQQETVRDIVNLLRTAKAVGGVKGQIEVYAMCKARLQVIKRQAKVQKIKLDLDEVEAILEDVEAEIALIGSLELSGEFKPELVDDDEQSQEHSPHISTDEGKEPEFSVEVIANAKKSKVRRKTSK